MRRAFEAKRAALKRNQMNVECVCGVLFENLGQAHILPPNPVKSTRFCYSASGTVEIRRVRPELRSLLRVAHSQIPISAVPFHARLLRPAAPTVKITGRRSDDPSDLIAARNRGTVIRIIANGEPLVIRERIGEHVQGQDGAKGGDRSGGTRGSEAFNSPVGDHLAGKRSQIPFPREGKRFLLEDAKTSRWKRVSEEVKLDPTVRASRLELVSIRFLSFLSRE